MNDKRFFNNPLFDVMPNGTPHYDVALTIKYNESKECQEKIALSPLQCYATLPLNNIGETYDRVRAESYYAMPENMVQWKYGDWAIGAPMNLNPKDVLKILTDHEKYVIK